MPHGLQLNPRTGVLHGTPNVAQAVQTHTILATNASGSTNTSLSIAVNPA